MITGFNRFEIEMTKNEAVVACSHSACDSDVAALVSTPKIKRQLDKIQPAAIAAELKEYGAWNDEELQDHAQNRQRIIWIAVSNIVEGV